MNSESEKWTACPAGVIGDTVRVVRTKRNRGLAVRATATVAGVMLLVALAVHFNSDRPGTRLLGGLTCQQTVKLLPDYLSGKLDAEMTARVQAHLHDCPGCLERFEKMRAGDRRATGRRPTVVAARHADGVGGPILLAACRPAMAMKIRSGPITPSICH